MGGRTVERSNKSTLQELLSFIDNFLQRKWRRVVQPPAPFSSTFDPTFDSPKYGNGHSAEKDFFSTEQAKAPAPAPAPAAAPAPASRLSSVTRKTTGIGAKKIPGGKAGGGLGVRKLTTKTSENLYDQKPAEPIPEPVVPSALLSSAQTAPRASCFVYSDEQSNQTNNTTSSGHVVVPSAVGDFFNEFGSGSGSQRQTSCSHPKAQVEDNGEAQKKFANAKSISSAQFFGDSSKSVDVESQARISKFANSSSISSVTF